MTTAPESRIAIISAMSAELEALRTDMDVVASGNEAGFRWWQGDLHGRACVVAEGGMGKVAAAACAQRLIDTHDLSNVLVCGVGGGLNEALKPGDIVVADALMQHDVDASPIFPRYQLPGLGIDLFRLDQAVVAAAVEAAGAFLIHPGITAAQLQPFGILQPRLAQGLVITGDQFIKAGQHGRLRASLPDALCVDMEGGAIAQVCLLNGVPFCLVRVISDNADASAAVDFERFVAELAPLYVRGLVRELLPRLP